MKYIKNILWRVAKHLSYIEDAQCLKVKGKVLSKMDLRRILCCRYRVGDNLKSAAAGPCEMLIPVCVTLYPRL